MASPTARLPAAEGPDQIVTTWLPLTTVYPLVPRCTEAFYSPDNLTYLYAWDPNENAALFQTHCLPDVATSWWDQNRSAAATTSLGPFLCPQAYTVAVTSTVGTSSTLTGCCPIGYSFVGLMSQGSPGGCASSFSSGQTITFAAPSEPNTDTYYTTTTVLTADQKVDAVQINGYNFKDNSAVPTYTGFSSISSSSSSSSSNLESTASQTSSSTSTQPSAAQSSAAASPGISTGTIVGIVVGVILGVVAMVAIIGILLFRRMRKRRHLGTSRAELSAAVPTPEFKMDQLETPPFVPQRIDPPVETRVHETNEHHTAEMDGQYRAEMIGNPLAEMDGSAAPVENSAYRRH